MEKWFISNGVRNLFLLVLVLITIGCSSDEESLYLFRDGEAKAVIVVQEAFADTNIEVAVVEAMEEFQYFVERATGKQLPVTTAEQTTNIPEEHLRVVIGPGALTESLGVDVSSFSEETWHIEEIDNHLVLTGRTPEAVRWSVHRFVDRFMGVRWLWPGEIGTYVPMSNTVSFPSGTRITDQPPLQWRNLSMRPPSDLRGEISEWMMRHMMGGDRSNLRVGHSFGGWWNRYGEEHPDLFADNRGMFPYRTHSVTGRRLSERMELCVSNPKVDEFIIREWQEAGKPDHWNIGNNDIHGRHCLCDNCLAMDEPPGQPLDHIWYSHADRVAPNLTARYVKFWVRLLEKMREIHPDVTLGAYAYSDYHFGPSFDIDLEGMVISFVGAYWEYEDWMAWERTGARMILRPNWWHTGEVAPHMPLREQGNFFRLAYENGMLAFNFDSIMGYWGAQGPLYYLIARLGIQPDRPVDEIITEYAGAFGPAKPAILKYLNYWDEKAEKAVYGIHGGPGIINPQPGLYEQVVIEHGLDALRSVHQNSWLVLPYLYPEEVTKEAGIILDRADKLVANSDGGDEYVHHRIQFLRDGLRYLEATREVFRLGYARTRPDDSDETWNQYIKAVQKMDALKDDVISPYVVWETANFYNVRQRRAWRQLWNRKPDETWEEYVQAIENLDTPRP